MDASLIDLLTQLKIIGMLRAHERFSTKGSMIRIEQQTRKFLTPSFAGCSGKTVRTTCTNFRRSSTRP